MRTLIFSAFFLFYVMPAQVVAQICYPPGSMVIGGVHFSCNAATTCIDPRIGDIGRASPGVGIWLHPMLNNYPVGVIGFVFAHECAHYIGILDEQQADGWAITIGRDQGWIDQYILQQICQSFYFSPGDWTHFPGPLRCQNMMVAFNSQ